MKLELNRKGIEALLKSEGVKRDLEQRTDRIAAAAGDGFEASVQEGRNRAHGSVITTDYESQLAEANNRALTRAINAGR